MGATLAPTAQGTGPPSGQTPARTPLPGLKLDKLQEVLHLYQADAGLGADDLNPRSWLMLPLPFLLRLIDILHAWEAAPRMIKEWIHLIVFKPKPGGGFRPIAQLVSVLRVWGRLRHEQAAEWEAKHLSSFFWGVEGRPSDRAGWEHNLYDEAALGQGDLTASFFGDIEKFYDNVSHHILWEESQAAGLPPRPHAAHARDVRGPQSDSHRWCLQPPGCRNRCYPTWMQPGHHGCQDPRIQAAAQTILA